MSFYLDPQVWSNMDVILEVDCGVSQCGCCSGSCSIEFLFCCAFFRILICRLFLRLCLALLFTSFLGRHHILWTIHEDISFWLASFIVLLKNAFGWFGFGWFGILIDVWTAFAFFGDGLFDKIRVIFFHNFELNRQGFFSFVEGSFRFANSFKNNKCLMKPIKEVIKLIIWGLNQWIWLELTFGVTELSILFGWERGSFVMAFRSFEESLDIHTW